MNEQLTIHLIAVRDSAETNRSLSEAESCPEGAFVGATERDLTGLRYELSV